MMNMIGIISDSLNIFQSHRFHGRIQHRKDHFQILLYPCPVIRAASPRLQFQSFRVAHSTIFQFQRQVHILQSRSHPRWLYGPKGDQCIYSNMLGFNANHHSQLLCNFHNSGSCPSGMFSQGFPEVYPLKSLYCSTCWGVRISTIDR